MVKGAFVNLVAVYYSKLRPTSVDERDGMSIILDLFYDLKDALAKKWNFIEPFGRSEGFFDPIRYEIGRYADGAVDFVLVVDYGDEGIELYWGWEDLVLPLRTIWRLEPLDLPGCERCENRHSPDESCFEMSAQEIVVGEQQLINAVMNEVERAMAYADPNLPQHPRRSDIKSIMESLAERWRQAVPQSDNGVWPRATHLDDMERVNGEEIQPRPFDDTYVLIWMEWHQGELARLLQFTAYQDALGWRIDCHNENGPTTFYRFNTGQVWSEGAICSCCESADVVVPTGLRLHKAVEELWDLLASTSRLID